MLVVLKGLREENNHLFIFIPQLQEVPKIWCFVSTCQKVYGLNMKQASAVQNKTEVGPVYKQQLFVTRDVQRQFLDWLLNTHSDVS